MNDTITAGAPVGNKNAAGHGSDGSLPKKFWAIRKGGRTTATGSHVGLTKDSLSEMARSHGEGAEVVFSDTPLNKQQEVGHLFGRTWEQIKNLQQGIKSSAPAASDVVRAAGTSEGAKKGWAVRKNEAWSLTRKAHEASHIAFTKSDPDLHSKAQNLHKEASEAHGEIASLYGEGTSAFQLHDSNRRAHEELEASHEIHKNHNDVNASSQVKNEVIHCRSHASAAGSVLAADKEWTAGESVEFMWMPAGTHTICAGFRNGSIELTVNCNEQTAAAVQASLEAWREERPKQEPFGCVEHREHEASVRVSAQQAFSFKQDGVYIAAEPTALGAQNVNGKVHRSWSPSFTTDADYSAAKTIKTASGAAVMVFPEGVRGSRSNPAEITGVDFCVGTLTNKPAFHAMSPVKSSEGEPVTASGTSEGAKKGWESRTHKTIDGDIHVSTNGRDVSVSSEHPEGGRVLQHEGKLDLSHGPIKELHVSYDAMKKKHSIVSVHQNGRRTLQHEARTDWNYDVRSSETAAEDIIHCRATLLQDMPDATMAEILAYEKAIDGGSSHVTAVAELKAQRKPEHVTQPAKAAEALTPETILARQADALNRANELAESKGAARTTLDEVYDKVTAGAPAGNKNAAGKRASAHADSLTDRMKISKGKSESGATKKDHLIAAAAHSEAASHYKDGDFMKDYHEGMASTHKEWAGEKTTGKGLSRPASYKASESTLDLESIYARAGANR